MTEKTLDEMIESLIKENESLRTENRELLDENTSLWFMLDEERESQNSIGQGLESALRQTIEDELLRNMKPIGDA